MTSGIGALVEREKIFRPLQDHDEKVGETNSDGVKGQVVGRPGERVFGPRDTLCPQRSDFVSIRGTARQQKQERGGSHQDEREVRGTTSHPRPRRLGVFYPFPALWVRSSYRRGTETNTRGRGRSVQVVGP